MHSSDLEAFGKKCYYFWFHWEEQDKSSDIEQQPPFGDRKISSIQPQNRGGVTKPTGTSYNFDKV